MPLYEYRCEDCDHRFEILQRIGEGSDGLTCPDCGEEHLVKQFSTFAAAGTEGGMSAGSTPAGGCCQGTLT